jgi:uncharacterized protein YqjF (DUF2071 family)
MDILSLLQQTDHRTAPMPTAPWIMVQKWHDLLFAHWTVPVEKLRPLVPRELELDLRDGKAYVAVAPFWMSGIRGRAMPPLPGLHTFPELNVRTYVTYQGIPGVYFFSLDAASRIAVKGARAFYGLPYFFAQMSIRNISTQNDGERFHYSSTRVTDSKPAELRTQYWPVSGPLVRQPKSLEAFLTERYCLYTVREGKVFRAYIHHLPWKLQDAQAEFEVNTMARAAGLDLPSEPPLLHFSRLLEVLIWWPQQVS